MVEGRISEVAVCLASATPLSTDISVHSAVFSLDDARGLTLFNQYGSNIRIIVAILNNPVVETTYIKQVESAAASIAREFPAAFEGLMNLDFSSKDVSSKIFTLRPADSISRIEPSLTIPTKFLLKTLALALRLKNIWSSRYSTPIPVFVAPPDGCLKIWLMLSLVTRSGPESKYMTTAIKNSPCLLLRT